MGKSRIQVVKTKMALVIIFQAVIAELVMIFRIHQLARVPLELSVVVIVLSRILAVIYLIEVGPIVDPIVAHHDGIAPNVDNCRVPKVEEKMLAVSSN